MIVERADGAKETKVGPQAAEVVVHGRFVAVPPVGTVMVQQDWRDLPALMEYARNHEFGHARAWMRFNHGVGA
ncbi:MAG: hypothetical protein H0W06_13040 [Chloroflexia bacterium]|nr:hypothetical protein [Chloroflexia bacterium]